MGVAQCPDIVQGQVVPVVITGWQAVTGSWKFMQETRGCSRLEVLIGVIETRAGYV